MKKFNIAAVCVPEKDYMVDITNKLKTIIKYIENKDYFTINQARQYGKSTILLMLTEMLKGKYLPIKISFEGMGDVSFSNEKEFTTDFIKLIYSRLHRLDLELANFLNENKNIDKLIDLSELITKLCDKSKIPIVLMIDEVDKASNNKLFLDFLGILRNKYIDRAEGYDNTFQSIILAGVHDIKNLKLKFRDEGQKLYNSPWNIATDFLVDLSFSSEEISTMLNQYETDNKVGINVNVISNEIYNHTSGYPFLVSKICKVIDERLNKDWSSDGIKRAVNIILNEKGTLFDDVIKNISNYKDLYNTVYEIIILGKRKTFNQYVYERGLIYGIFKKGKDNSLLIHNRIFETLIYNLMIEKQKINENFDSPNQFIDMDGDLDIRKILIKFQEFMIQEYRNSDEEFLEAQGRLIFLAFIKPIINGKGHYFIEVESRNKTRLDVVITYNKKIYIIELKIWRGKAYYEKGLDQLSNYLDVYNQSKGYMVIFNFSKNKEYKKEEINIDDRIIYFNFGFPLEKYDIHC